MSIWIGETQVMLCCETTLRMEEDVKCLRHDSKILSTLKSQEDRFLGKYEKLVSDLEQRLSALPASKHHYYRTNLTETQISEFVALIRHIWLLISEKLWELSQLHKFHSARGIPVSMFIERILKFNEYINQFHVKDFFHAECATLYSLFVKEFINSAEELSDCDRAQSLIQYYSAAGPVLYRLIKYVDLYTYDSKYTDLSYFCREMLRNEAQVPVKRKLEATPIRYLGALLRETLLGEEPIPDVRPIVEGRKTCFYEFVGEMYSHFYSMIKNVARIAVQTQQNPGLKTGSLDPKFVTALPLKKRLSGRLSSSRSRGRPRGTTRRNHRPLTIPSINPDLIPILDPTFQLSVD